MKCLKKFLLLITFSVAGLTIKSQEISKSRIGMGFHYYQGISTICGETIRDKSGLKLSYGLGISGEMSINNNLVISSEIQYVRKGYRIEDNSIYQYEDLFYIPDVIDTVLVCTSTEYTENSKINSFSIPVTCKYYTGNKIRYYCLLGIYASYLINHYEVWERGFITPGNQPLQYAKSQNVKSAVKIDFGVNIGTGILVPITNRLSFEIGPTACLGFKDIFSPVSTLFYNKITDKNQKNVVLSLKTSVLLNF